MVFNNKVSYCLVCGFDISRESDEDSIKPFFICPCCLFQYGIDEPTYGANAYVEYRNDWIAEGLPYGGELQPNESWGLESALTQLTNLKKVKIKYYSNFYDFMAPSLWSPNFDEESVRKLWFENR